MKAKTLVLMTLSILALVLTMGLMSAVSSSVFTITDVNVPTSVAEDAGSFTFTFNLTYTGTSEDMDISFDDSTTSIGGISIPTATGMNGSIDESKIITGTISNFANQGGNTINVIINATTTGDSRDDETTFSVSITDVFNFCAYDDGTTTNDANLKVDIRDITVSGFGEEDNEWVPLDEIEVEIRVDNKGNYDVDDISLEWGIVGDDLNEDWVVEFDEIDEFNLKDGDRDTFIITFRVDEDDLDFNLEDLVGNDYNLVVRATGTIDDSDAGVLDEKESCASDFEQVSIVKENDFLILDNFQIEGISLEDGKFYPDKLSCGSTLQLTADIWNIGDSEQNDIELRIYNSDFGIDEILEIGDVDAFDKESISFEFTIPEGMEEGWNTLEFTIQEDGDIFENDYTDEDAEFEVLIDLENCALSQALVSASLDEGGKAGRELVVRSTITNTGTKSTTYLVNAVGYSEWASLINVDPSTTTLEAGQSADVLITLKVNRDVSGERLFNIEVLSEGELVVSQPLSVSVEKALIGDIFGDNGLLTTLIIGIALILVIIIIVLAVRVARR